LKNDNELKISKIRYLDIGKNHFRYINPMKKKNLTILLDNYLNCLKPDDVPNFDDALNLYFENRLKNQDMNKIENLELNKNFLWHIYCLVVIDRLSCIFFYNYLAMYARFEYLDYAKKIDRLNKVQQKNKVKYVITSHPT
jgi:hypothetical protein